MRKRGLRKEKMGKDGKEKPRKRGEEIKKKRDGR